MVSSNSDISKGQSSIDASIAGNRRFCHPPGKQAGYFQIFFWLFLLLYSAFILYRPDFGLIDDIGMVMSYVSGKPLPVFISPADGRFALLEGQEYIPIAFFSTKALSFYLLNAFQLLLTGWLLVTVGKLHLNGRGKALAYAFPAVVMLNPGFIEAWLRLKVSERSEFFLLILFFLCFIKLHRIQNSWFMLPCLTAAGTALYYKETAFILVGAIGIFHLCLNRRSTIKSRILDICIVGLSAIYLVTYYVFVYRFRGPHLYNESSVKPVYALIHTLASNALHDPWIILCLLILLCLRVKQVIIKRNIEPILDSVLLSSFLFYMGYLVLHMSNIYYLLPLYVFVPYVGCSVASNPSLKRVFPPSLIVLLSVLLLTQVLSGMREVLTWKFAPTNFQAVLKVISVQIDGSHGKFNMFLGGSSRGSGIELYSNLATYLIYLGFHPGQFDIKSNTPIDYSIPYINTLHSARSCPFSYCNPAEDDQPAQGDYILLTPYDSIYRRSIYSDRSHYQLVFQTNTPIVPDPSLKTLADHLFPRELKNAGSGMIDTNYYLYKAL